MRIEDTKKGENMKVEKNNSKTRDKKITKQKVTEKVPKK